MPISVRFEEDVILGLVWGVKLAKGLATLATMRKVGETLQDYAARLMGLGMSEVAAWKIGYRVHNS